MKTNKRFNVKKFRSIVIRMAAMACTFIMAMGNEMITFAAHNAENGTPTNAKTATYSALVTIVFWIIRVIIIIIGAGPAFIKITQAMSDENPRDRNSGIAALVVSGAAFAATFAVEQLI